LIASNVYEFAPGIIWNADLRIRAKKRGRCILITLWYCCGCF